ncbi:MAG: UDPGP type 1 family protein [Phycisphaerae bacterium]|nr:UDPGP type 1 family protein [Phycisphaerae bacterium]NIP52126.1 UDPGP type 1 family protein [Phycisphaerae bacterium]NIS51131.1 UDPGP type 1 family protein [Phycisphaerae bacterium]NIU08801.1 UDPGP type 1 family protein [Phycisphaerae bacterium]NIU56410.1 UDPGP type 1 family protein [Phycisphaerae bacterium]
MVSQSSFENVEKLLKKHNQSHILSFWGELGESERKNLLGQIQVLDFAKIADLAANLSTESSLSDIDAELVPAGSYGPIGADAEQNLKYDKAIELGKKLISEGKVGAFVVAGGQGTRLGFDRPKGDFPISPVKNKTLFRIFGESITAVSSKYGAACPWYIMTSPMNHADTREIFRSNGYYGLRERDVFIFEQGTLPNFSFEGKILLAEKGRIACSPDGHGGSLKALYKSGAVDDMKKRGVEFISYWQVDNPLVNIFDPLFIGLHALDEAEISSKALVKTGPMEKVGNFCLVDDKVTVIEYSDFPDEVAERRNPDGSLVFQLGSIAIHIINAGFVEKLNTGVLSLPFHRAVKKIPHIDQSGRCVEPAEPNGIKLETFIFDALPMASKSIILETERSEEFAPVKNATGVDSAETAREMMIARAVSWLESAGITVPRKPDGSVDCVIEIAPSFALEKDDIKAKLNQIPEIKPGDEVYLA